MPWVKAKRILIVLSILFNILVISFFALRLTLKPTPREIADITKNKVHVIAHVQHGPAFASNITTIRVNSLGEGHVAAITLEWDIDSLDLSYRDKILQLYLYRRDNHGMNGPDTITFHRLSILP
jgi:hypothetical protein